MLLVTAADDQVRRSKGVAPTTIVSVGRTRRRVDSSCFAGFRSLPPEPDASAPQDCENCSGRCPISIKAIGESE
jgi:hypothetical protein